MAKKEKVLIYISWVCTVFPDKPSHHSRKVESRELADIILRGSFGLVGNRYVDQSSIQVMDYTGMKEY
jgi:hypothetical protein